MEYMVTIISGLRVRENLCCLKTTTRIMEFKGISFGLSTHTLIFWLKITLKIPLIFYPWVLKYPYFSQNNDKIRYFSAHLGHFRPFVAKTVQKYPYATQCLSTQYPYFSHNLEYSV